MYEEGGREGDGAVGGGYGGEEVYEGEGREEVGRG